MIPLGIVVGLFTLFYITSPLIILVHELGHAFAYLILTKPAYVNVYIGSYGRHDIDLRFRIGKLNFFISRKLLIPGWRGACASNSQETNYFKKIIILSAGSIFTFVLALIIACIAFNYDMHGAIKLFCVALILFSILGLCSSLYPFKSSDGLDNDGRQILFAIKLSKVFKEYVLGIEAYNNSNFESAAVYFKIVSAKIPGDEKVLRLLTNCLIQTKSWEDVKLYLNVLKQTGGFTFNDYLTLSRTHSALGENDIALSACWEALILKPDNQDASNLIISLLILLKRYEKAGEYLIKLKATGNFGINDYINLGFIQSISEQSEQATENYLAALQIEPENLIALNNLAYEYINKNKFDDARPLLEKALHHYPDSPTLLNSLGFLEISSGNLLEGKALIDRTLLAEEANAYAYKHLAMYFFKMNDKQNGIKNLQRAQEMDQYIRLASLFDEAANLPNVEDS